MATKPTPERQPTETFESAIERLESIVEAMESDRLSLEQLIERYEEGTKLVKICQTRLEAAEKRIEIISRGAAGKPQLAEFDPQAPAPAATAAKSSEAPSKSDDDDVSLF